MTRAFIASLLVFVCGCGGGGSTAPSPSSSLQSPTITTANTMIYVGQTVQFAATGSGTIRWGTDAPGVAAVDVPSGRVTGAGIGRATIWAENEGGRTTRGLRGLPSYAGNWQGTYAIVGCQATGDFLRIRFCTDFFSQGEMLSIGLQMSQTDDRVSGSFAFGDLVGALSSASVSDAGQLPATGQYTDGEGSISLQNARWESPSPGTITGTFDQSWSVIGASGSGILSCEIRGVTRTSGGPILSHRPTATGRMSLEEMIRRARRK
jgi:hypothetical protein